MLVTVHWKDILSSPCPALLFELSRSALAMGQIAGDYLTPLAEAAEYAIDASWSHGSSPLNQLGTGSWVEFQCRGSCCRLELHIGCCQSGSPNCKVNGNEEMIIVKINAIKRHAGTMGKAIVLPYATNVCHSRTGRPDIP